MFNECENFILAPRTVVVTLQKSEGTHFDSNRSDSHGLTLLCSPLNVMDLRQKAPAKSKLVTHLASPSWDKNSSIQEKGVSIFDPDVLQWTVLLLHDCSLAVNNMEQSFLKLRGKANFSFQPYSFHLPCPLLASDQH